MHFVNPFCFMAKNNHSRFCNIDFGIQAGESSMAFPEVSEEYYVSEIAVSALSACVSALNPGSLPFSSASPVPGD